MSACQRIREAALDALTQGAELPVNVRAHVEGCPACRAELEDMERLWSRLSELTQPTPRQVSTHRIAAALQHAALTPKPERTIMRTSLLAAALLAGVLIGGAGVTLRSRTASNAPAESGSMFLLLLHESSSSHEQVTAAQMDSIVNEYRGWAMRLRDEQKLVGAEKLRDEAGRWLEPSGKLTVSEPDEHVSGYFVVRAPDYDAAVAIARASPHLKYGGTIEVRAIQNTSGSE